MHNLKLYVQGFFFAIGVTLGLAYSNYQIGIEPFGSMKRFDKILCYGWYFKIPIFFGKLKFCIPGLALPAIGGYKRNSSGKECDGSDVCE